MDEIQTIHSHHYSFALRFLVLQTHATSYCFYSSCSYCTLHERRKEENLLVNHIMPRNLNEFGFCCGNVVTMYCIQYKYCMYNNAQQQFPRLGNNKVQYSQLCSMRETMECSSPSNIWFLCKKVRIFLCKSTSVEEKKRMYSPTTADLFWNNGLVSLCLPSCCSKREIMEV